MADIERKQDGTVEITVTVDQDAWKSAQKKTFDKLKSRISMKGFRKGHVPASYARKVISDGAVINEAVDEVIQKTFNDVMRGEASGLQLLDQPAVAIKDATTDNLSLVFTLHTVPEAEVSQYKNLGIVKEEVSVSDEEVDKAIAQLLARNADWLLVEDESPAKEGDKVSITFKQVGEDASDDQEDEEIVLGAGRLFKDFEDQIIGIKTNETKNVHIVYPEDYVAKDMRGKEADFEVTVNEIHTKDVPALSDETVAELSIPEVTTVEALKTMAHDNLLKSKEDAAEQNYVKALMDAIAEHTTVALPSVMIDRETDRAFQNFAQRIQQSGFSVAEFMETANTTPEMLKENFRPEAEETLKKDLALRAIVKAENISVSDEELEEELNRLATEVKIDVETIKRSLDPEVLRSQLMDRKVLDFLKSVQ